MSDSVRPHKQQTTRHPRPWDSPGRNTGVGCHFLLQCIKVKSESEVARSCPTLSDPLDCSPPGSSVHGISSSGNLRSSWLGTLTFDPVVKHWCFSCLDISTVGNPPFSGVLNQHHLINNISYSKRQIESCLVIKRICSFYLLSVVNDTEVNNTLKVFTHMSLNSGEGKKT